MQRNSGKWLQKSDIPFAFPFLSVSSFVKKTTEKINTLQMNSELRQRPEFRESIQAENAAPCSEEMDHL